MKNKNPLYVVKDAGGIVEEASSAFDFLVKKFHLEPLVELIKSLIEMILEQVNSYQGIIIAREFIEKILGKLELFKKFGIA